MSSEISFLKNHFFRNFISIFYIRSWWILRNDFEIWHILLLVPWYIISQNHFSKSLLKIFAQNLTIITRAHVPGHPVWLCVFSIAQHCGGLPTQPRPSKRQPAPICNENDKNISTKIINILIILKCFFIYPCKSNKCLLSTPESISRFYYDLKSRSKGQHDLSSTWCYNINVQSYCLVLSYYIPTKMIYMSVERCHL